MVFKMKGWNGWSPLKHGENPKGDKPHTKFKTETEHEEYHDIYPTKDLNEAELKEAEKETLPMNKKKKTDAQKAEDERKRAIDRTIRQGDAPPVTKEYLQDYLDAIRGSTDILT